MDWLFTVWRSTYYLEIFALAHYGLVIIVTFWLLRREREPLSTLLWLFIIFAFPILGSLIYCLLGVHRIPTHHTKRERRRALSDLRFKRHVRKFMIYHNDLQRHYRVTTPRLPDNLAAFNATLDRMYSPPPLLTGNTITLLGNAEEALDQMINAITTAKCHIHIASYIIANDCVGKHLMNALKDAAKRGVQVNVLYDAIGSMYGRIQGLFKRYNKIPNLRLEAFSHAHHFHFILQENVRNHRKILVVDGTKGFTGGVNFHNAYLNTPTKRGIRDLHVVLTGPIVVDLQSTFLRDWYYTTKEFPGRQKLIADIKSTGDQTMRLLNNGPTEKEYDIGNNLFNSAIISAEKQIIIVTPYFIPTAEIQRSLILAALRGVQVKILVPKANNHPLIAAASRSYYSRLLKVGIRIFQRHAPFIHTKAMIIDSQLSIIGSSNIDPRSLNLNYESNIVTYDSIFADSLKAELSADFDDAEEVFYAIWRRRSNYKRIIENVCNLFHPTL